MGKHAYLIMAHHQFEILEKTLQLLDDVRNDFFIHIDSKTQSVDFEALRSKVRYSKIFFIDRMSVNWGGYSMIRCELALLSAATSAGHYAYYHLLSGVDLPIKRKEEIFAFFDKDAQTEYVHFAEVPPRDEIMERISKYHLCMEMNRRNLFVRIQKRFFVAAQKLLHVNRTAREKEQYAYGANWFSITDAFARYVLEYKKWIAKHFKHSNCADELFLQTIVVNSDFLPNVYACKQQMQLNDYHAIMRAIDWERGQPYVYRMEDLEPLLQSDYLFARKFDLKVDGEIVNALFQRLIRA